MKTLIITLMMGTVATIDAPVAETYAEMVEMRVKIVAGLMKQTISHLLLADTRN